MTETSHKTKDSKQPAFVCNECRQPVGRRPAGTHRAYCHKCDHMVDVHVLVGRR